MTAKIQRHATKVHFKPIDFFTFGNFLILSFLESSFQLDFCKGDSKFSESLQ